MGSAWVGSGYGAFGREEKELVIVEAWVGGVELLGKGWGIFFEGRERGKFLAAHFFLLYD